MFSLFNKNILITGASSGIGRECAITASQFGANIILLARDKTRLKETHNKLKKGNHLYFSQDITEFSKLEKIIETSVKKIGRISGFIHSAGIEMTVPLRQMNPIQYQQLFSLNVISGFELARIISKKEYLSDNYPSFVFISSVMDSLGQKGKIGYCSSKGALLAGCKAMALELVNKNVRVNCVSSGVIKTDMSKKMFDILPKNSFESIINMHPLGLGTPQDIANVCIFLLSDSSKWITGTNIIVDGGYSAA
jgi:NAD(P)-dependent dehydrogenase (short-subunit alcohol dehydrogenase family)